LILLSHFDFICWHISRSVSRLLIIRIDTQTHILHMFSSDYLHCGNNRDLIIYRFEYLPHFTI